MQCSALFLPVQLVAAVDYSSIWQSDQYWFATSHYAANHYARVHLCSNRCQALAVCLRASGGRGRQWSETAGSWHVMRMKASNACLHTTYTHMAPMHTHLCVFECVSRRGACTLLILHCPWSASLHAAYIDAVHALAHVKRNRNCCGNTPEWMQCHCMLLWFH